jgi:hypothetical protein
LKVFCDDSGSDGGEFCVLAGYLFDDPSVECFSKQWRAELAAPPGIKYFKMVEAESRRGEFWSWDPSERDQKLAALANVVKGHVLYGVGSFISHQAYDSIARAALPPTVDHPYWFCFQGIIAVVLQLFENGIANGKVDFVFDGQGEGFERRAGIMHSNLKEMIPDVLPNMIGTISFSDDNDVAPLQAADLLAWHIRRHSNSMAKDGLAEPRPIADLLWSVPTLTKAWHPNEIAEFVEFYHKAHPYSPQNRDGSR